MDCNVSDPRRRGKKLRAIYIPGSFQKKVGETFTYNGDSLHHLKNVIRINVGEDLLVLNGKGLSILTKVESILKKEIVLSIAKLVERDCLGRKCIVSKLKRDSLELSLKSAIEMGVSKFYIVQTDFSQNFKLNRDRLQKVAVSAMIQSNNPYLCEIVEVPSFESCLDLFGSDLIVFDMIDSNLSSVNQKSPGDIVFIGPEGGFSQNEREIFVAKGIRSHAFDTPIMRAETALISALSYNYL